MPRLVLAACLLGGMLILMATGCAGSKPAPTAIEPALDESKFPPHVAGTVAQYAMLVGGGDLTLRGYGIVVGLGANGSRECPPALRGYLTQYMLKQKVFSPSSGTGGLSPAALLDSLDTAVVELWGRVPPGAPAGTTFDVYVRAMPQTQTTSLDGGYLLPHDMQMSVEGLSGTERQSRVLGKAGGPVFVNPFVDPSNAAEAPKLREGRIIGGGKLLEDRRVQLQLHQADYARCDAMTRQINAVFPASRPVAIAKNSNTVELDIPRRYRGDYERFLSLVMHLPVKGGPGAWEAKARQVAQQMQEPGAEHDELALIWEAMGRNNLPILKTFYRCDNPALAYYSARTGLRLGDAEALRAVCETARNVQAGPLQLQAVRELGRCRLHACLPTLYDLLDDSNDLVRVAACEALIDQGDRGRLRRLEIGDAKSGLFELDVVDARSRFMIYASQSQQPRLLVFGKSLSLPRPLFFNAPGDLVTIDAQHSDSSLTVYRKILSTGRCSSPFQVPPDVPSLVEALAGPVEYISRDRTMGLGLTYGQVVSVLYRLCQSGDLRAKFVLQPLPEMQRIYLDETTVGRPDTPEM